VLSLSFHIDEDSQVRPSMQEVNFEAPRLTEKEGEELDEDYHPN
jgi:hypothetical protein